MKIQKTKIDGVYIIEPDFFKDDRGLFLKPFNKDIFKKNGLVCEFEENFYSMSKKDVIRGMHFQNPPNDHAKLIYVPKGAILDVVLDIRNDSPTYGQYVSEELSDQNFKIMYIPRGCAHGFLSLVDDSCTVYLQETVRVAESENGVNINSFGIEWGVKNPIVSERDRNFKNLNDFKSPFN